MAIEHTAAGASSWLTIALSVAGTIATILVGFGVYWLTRRGTSKALSYDYTVVSVGGVRADLPAELELTFRGVPVKDVSLVSITFRNSGKIPIQRSDFDQDLIVSIPAQRISRVISNSARPPQPKVYSIQDPVCTPRDLNVTARLPASLQRGTQNSFCIEPVLLNPGDHFTVVALISGFADQVSVAGRIVGVSRILRKDLPKPPPPLGVRIVTGLMFSASVFLLATSFLPSLRVSLDRLSMETPTWVNASISLVLIGLTSKLLFRK